MNIDILNSIQIRMRTEKMMMIIMKKASGGWDGKAGCSVWLSYQRSRSIRMGEDLFSLNLYMDESNDQTPFVPFEFCVSATQTSCNIPTIEKKKKKEKNKIQNNTRNPKKKGSHSIGLNERPMGEKKNYLFRSNCSNDIVYMNCLTNTSNIQNWTSIMWNIEMMFSNYTRNSLN